MLANVRLVAAALFFSFLSISNSLYADWVDASDSLSISSTRAAFDRVNRVYFSYIDVTNTSGESVVGPVRVLVDNSTLPILNAAGESDGGVPYFSVSENEITAGETVRVRANFQLQRKRLSFKTVAQYDVTPTAIQIKGRALLGVLTGADITLRALQGEVLAETTSALADDLDGAGSFSIEIDSSSLPDVFIIEARGGSDSDINNDGILGDITKNNGSVRAIVTKSHEGSVSISALSEILFLSLQEKYPDILPSLEYAELVEAINAEAQMLLNVPGDNTEILAFNPSTNQQASMYVWEEVLSIVVPGIYTNEFDYQITKRINALKAAKFSNQIVSSQQGEALALTKYDVIETNINVVTSYVASDDGINVDYFNQYYVTQDGVLVDLKVARLAEDSMRLNFEVAFQGQTLQVNGISNFISGLEFTPDSLRGLADRLISVNRDRAQALKIIINKTVSERISDNELEFLINGRVPSTEELAVLKDDPEISWRWQESAAADIPKISASGSFEATDLGSVNWTEYTSGIIIFEMNHSTYDVVAGLNSDNWILTANGLSTLMGDALLSLTVHPLAAAASIISDAAFILRDGLSLIAERTLTSARPGLLGKFDPDGKIIPGENYLPLVFFRNLATGLDGQVRFSMKGECKISTSLGEVVPDPFKDPGCIKRNGRFYYSGFESQTLGKINVKPNKGYMAVFPKSIATLDLPTNDDNYYLKLQLEASVGAQKRSTAINYSKDSVSPYASFTSITDEDEVILNARGSYGNGAEINEYRWEIGGEGPFFANNRADPKIRIPSSSINLEPAKSEIAITLKIKTTNGASSEITKLVPVSPSWNSKAPLLYDDFESGLSKWKDDSGLPRFNAQILQGSNGNRYLGPTTDSQGNNRLFASLKNRFDLLNEDVTIELDFLITPNSRSSRGSGFSLNLWPSYEFSNAPSPAPYEIIFATVQWGPTGAIEPDKMGAFLSVVYDNQPQFIGEKIISFLPKWQKLKMIFTRDGEVRLYINNQFISEADATINRIALESMVLILSDITDGSVIFDNIVVYSD